MTRPSQGRRICVFCGGTPVTTEDVFAKWIQRYLGRRQTVTLVGSPDTGVQRQFPNLSYTAKAKVVCARCNNGWMSALEEEAGALLRAMFTEHITMQLASESQILLARWAMKTALMLQFTQKLHGLPDTVYREFHAIQRPPAKCLIYLARREMVQQPSGGHTIVTELGMPSASGGITKLGHLYGVTFFIKNLVMQVIGYVLQTSFTPNLQFPQTFQPYVQRIWPSGPSVSWPPPNPTMTEHQALEFGLALAHIGRRPMIST